MSYSKDKDEGMPKFVSEKDKEFVSLIFTDDLAKPEIREKNIKSPGWALAKTYARTGGRPPRHISETLIAFSGAGTMSDGSNPPDGDPEGFDPITGRHYNPPLSIGLSGISDWNTSLPFLNVMKSSRPWIGHAEGQWGAYQFDRLENLGHVDSNGYPTTLPEDCTSVESLLLTDLPEAMTQAAGRYVLTWEGTSSLRVGGRAQNSTNPSSNRIEFDFSPGPGMVTVSIQNTGAALDVRNVVVVKEDNEELLSSGSIFNPNWIDDIKNFRLIRFMDWQNTNWSLTETLSDLISPEFTSWSVRSVPIEIMVRLANYIGADPWFCIPHKADRALVEHLANYVKVNLDEKLIARFEYSNETWNFMFSGPTGQTTWLQDQGNIELPGVGNAWMQMAGVNAAKNMDIVSSVYGSQTNFKRVMSVHTEWEGLEEGFMEATEYVAKYPETRAPKLSFDEYAVTGYFDGGISSEEMIPTLRDWISAGTFVQNAYAQIIDDNGPVSGEHRTIDLLKRKWTYHKGVTDRENLSLVMYEGGTHTVVHPSVDNDESLLTAFAEFNYTSQMADLYQAAFDAWYAITGHGYNIFVETTGPGKHGYWGGKRYTGDSNPRWSKYVEWNNGHVGDWETRDKGTFIGEL